MKSESYIRSGFGSGKSTETIIRGIDTQIITSSDGWGGVFLGDDGFL